MCGISGIINFDKKPVGKIQIQTMMKRMKHRGPDDEGIYIDNNIGFGFVRLSIIDLSELAHQPMFDETGRYMILHNGEVYNYIEIRKLLIQKGYQFRSDSDTEVILNSYIEWGQDCLHKFNGMWAFCIYDLEKKTIFLSRDRFGIKPLYYFQDNKQFIFSSEISPIISYLKKYTGISIMANNEAIFDYLVFNRTDQSEKTFFKDILKLQHGCNLKISQNRVSASQWYKLENNINKSSIGPEEYYELFNSSIGLRLRSDVPIGVCLSGGLDSSSIVSTLIKEYNRSDLNTFSAIYSSGQTGDESTFISEYKSDLESMHFVTPTANNLLNDLDSFINAHGEPIPSTSPYAQFKVMELAKNHVTVTLDGQGADESLAGYHYFFGYHLIDCLKKFNFIKLSSELFNYTIKHQSLYALKAMIYFLIPSFLQTKLRIKNRGYINDNFIREYGINSIISTDLFKAGSLQQSLINHFEYKLEHLLKWEDRNSMFFSLESRVPFLDHKLVESTLGLNSDMLIKNGTTKIILREAMKKSLPNRIYNRQDKIGFGTPQAEWFRTKDFRFFIKDIINSDKFKQRGIINHEIANNLFDHHCNNRLNISDEIWKWINLELWFQGQQL